jgi:hypothetical protein
VESTAEKFVRIVRKKNTIFVVSVKSIVEEEEVVAKLLEEYKDVFLVKSLLNLLPKRSDDDHAMPTVLRVRLQARSLYKLTPEEREVLKHN